MLVTPVGVMDISSLSVCDPGRSWLMPVVHLVSLWKENAKKKGLWIILGQLVSFRPSFISSLVLKNIIKVSLHLVRSIR